jgi:hypothetical protein
MYLFSVGGSLLLLGKTKTGASPDTVLAKIQNILDEVSTYDEHRLTIDRNSNQLMTN